MRLIEESHSRVTMVTCMVGIVRGFFGIGCGIVRVIVVDIVRGFFWGWLRWVGWLFELS